MLERNLASIEEIKARQGPVLAITQTDAEIPVQDVVKVPDSHEILDAIVMLIPLQLLAYHAALQRDCDVDQPRNLAKSVTVE